MDVGEVARAALNTCEMADSRPPRCVRTLKGRVGGDPHPTAPRLHPRCRYNTHPSSTRGALNRNGGPTADQTRPISVRAFDWSGELALEARIHPKVVSERLGHATVGITLDLYSHVLDGMQAEAAEQIGAIVFGG